MSHPLHFSVLFGLWVFNFSGGVAVVPQLRNARWDKKMQATVPPVSGRRGSVFADPIIEARIAHRGICASPDAIFGSHNPTCSRIDARKLPAQLPVTRILNGRTL
jgi:hypothetical protein